MSTSFDHQAVLRKHLLELLSEDHAHVGFTKAVHGLSHDLQGKTVPHVLHSPWQLLEHLRIAQHDIVEFTLDTRHKSPKWPDEYWPDTDAPSTAAAWKHSVAGYVKDRRRMIDVVNDTSIDLLAPLKHGDGQTVAREAILLGDHTAYHVGQLIIVRKVLGAWKE